MIEQPDINIIHVEESTIYSIIFAECTTIVESGFNYRGSPQAIIDPNATGPDRMSKVTDDIESCQDLCSSINVKYFHWFEKNSRCWCKTALNPDNKVPCQFCHTGESYCASDETDAKWRDEGREHVVGFEWLTR